MTSSGGPRSKVVHCFVCSLPLLAASGTGLVEDAGTSVLLEEVTSVLLVCGVLLTVLEVVTSRG